jgi:methanogenic corrinoid protein MtbC1
LSVPDVDTANSPAIGADELALVCAKLWGAVVDCDEYAAVTTIFAAVEAGMAPETILLDVIARVQHKIGTEWAANRITVAQ